MSMTIRGATVVGVFDDREEAREAIQALKDEGFNGDAISILSPDKQATEDIAEETGTHAAAGAASGALTGGVLGGLGGWLVGIGALAIPGVGPFIAAGAFATALGGAAIGAGVGAIAGALVGMGVPEEHAKYYEGEAKAGKTLVTVQANDRYDDAQRILRDYGAYDVESRHRVRATGDPTLHSRSAARQTDYAQDTMQLREEELVTDQRTLDVPVSREEVIIERQPVDRRPSDRPMDDGAETVSVPVRDEGASGNRWEDTEAGYRYGHEMRSRPEFRGRTWNDVEPEARRDWTERNPSAPWERARESVRDAWERTTER